LVRRFQVPDPGRASELRGIGCPEPAGVTAAALVDAIAAVRARFPLAGAGITEFTPWSVAEAAAIWRRSGGSSAR
jgi:hypothetical protein